VAAGRSRLAISAFFISIAAPGVAAAQEHPLVAEARGQADRADFAAALATLDRAERADDLDRAALEQLLLLRALAQVGLGREREARRDLRRLAAISPNIDLPDTVPPAVREALDRVRNTVTPISLTVDVENVDDAVEVRARIEGEEGVAREVRLAARERGSRWGSAARGSSEASVRVPASGAAIEARVTAIGPGGAVIAERGTEAEPLVVREATTEPSDALRPPDDDGEDNDEGGGALWPILGTTAAVVVVGVVVAVFLVGSSSGGASDGEFGAPTVAWP
jgi:hypothetical protein